ncbi:MAG: hypothetical protein IZT59_08120 [Verrucomicrobia bacterium]|jgi:hypothetical protein|nr:hypothetical protein [Verrucomicrobiota bacterium]
MESVPVVRKIIEATIVRADSVIEEPPPHLLRHKYYQVQNRSILCEHPPDFYHHSGFIPFMSI